MVTKLIHANKFFALARERYNILLRRRAGQSWPWTTDTHLQTWRFTNIFREDDKTTTWFRVNVRDPLSQLVKDCPRSEVDAYRLGLVEATMIFRWFNRIETGELIKNQLLRTDLWNSQDVYDILQGEDKIFTGAYIIIGKPYMSKLAGVLEAIDDARPRLPRMVPNWGPSLQIAWEDLITIDYIGGFSAHEIVQDLRYTPILENAADVNSWGHLGPGATRGISWLCFNHGDGFNNSVSGQKEMLGLMAELLEMSRDPANWPAEWPKWEMHQVEFLLCETAKYFRSYNGHRQKRRYQR